MFYNVDTCLPFNFGSHYSELPFVVACLRIYSNSVQYKCYLNPALKMGQTMYLFCFFCLFSNKYRSSTHSMAFTRAITQKKFTRFSKQLSILGFFFIHCWSFSNKQYNLLQQINVKNVHPVHGAWIQTHNFQNTSLISQPLDQSSDSKFDRFYSIPKRLLKNLRNW